jgi:hypothetical protein
MEQTNEKLFEDLIRASRVLVTVTNNAATVLSEEFEDMVTGPAASVQAILDKCPEGGIAWDGTFNEDDVLEGEWKPGYLDEKGVKLSHKLSGKSVLMHYKSGSNKVDIEETRSRAMNALQDMVERYVSEQRKIGAL